MTGLIFDPHAAESTQFGAEMEMVRDIATAITPALRAMLPRVDVRLRIPPEVPATAMTVQFGDELHNPTIEQQAEMKRVMDAIRVTSQRLFPTIPLVLEILRPPVSPRWGFVAHVQEDPYGQGRIYPRIVTARAVLRPSNRDRAIAALEGKL